MRFMKQIKARTIVGMAVVFVALLFAGRTYFRSESVGLNVASLTHKPGVYYVNLSADGGMILLGVNMVVDVPDDWYPPGNENRFASWPYDPVAMGGYNVRWIFRRYDSLPGPRGTHKSFHIGFPALVVPCGVVALWLLLALLRRAVKFLFSKASRTPSVCQTEPITPPALPCSNNDSHPP